MSRLQSLDEAQLAEAFAAAAAVPGFDKVFLDGVVSAVKAQIAEGILTPDEVAADLDALKAKLKATSKRGSAAAQIQWVRS